MVSNMLDVIRVYLVSSGDVDQSKQLRSWTMEDQFIDACGDMEVAEMLGIAYVGNCTSLNIQAFLSFQDWKPTNCLRKSPSAFFQTALKLKVCGVFAAAAPDLGPVSTAHDEPGVAEPKPEGVSVGNN